MLWRVIKPYTTKYAQDVIFKKGEIVTIKEEFKGNKKWVGWIWGIGRDNKEAWIPKQFLIIQGNNAKFIKEYNAKEMHLTNGEMVHVNEFLNGFVYAIKENGESGWVPADNLIK